MRRDVLYAGATAVGLGVLVLAGVGVASLVDDDRSLSLDETSELVEARSPSVQGAGELAMWWAIAHERRGETIPGRGCAVASQSRPFRYTCDISYRDKAGRYRGVELTLVEREGHAFKVVRVRSRRAGPAGAPQQR